VRCSWCGAIMIFGDDADGKTCGFGRSGVGKNLMTARGGVGSSSSLTRRRIEGTIPGTESLFVRLLRSHDNKGGRHAEATSSAAVRSCPPASAAGAHTGGPAQMIYPCRTAPDGQRLWKIGRKFYALEQFAKRHPGGSRMIHLARDYFEDSTFAFESHHTNLPKALVALAKYEVTDHGQDAADAACGPLLTPAGSFGAVLKERVRAHLKTTENGDGPTRQCVRLFFALLWAWVLLFCLTAAAQSAALGLGAALCTGGCGALLAGFGHNWVHQPRYHSWAWVLDIEGLNGDTWVMGHLLMHHMYTNTPSDNHFSILEPFLVTDPTRSRNWAQRVWPRVMAPVTFAIASFLGYAILSVRLLLGACGVRGHIERARFERADGKPELDIDMHLLNHNGHPTWLLLWAQLAVLVYSQGWGWGVSLFCAKNGLVSFWYLVNAFANHNSDAAWRITERVHATSWYEAQVYSCSDIGAHYTFLQSAAHLWLNYHTVHHLFPHTCMSKHPGIQRVLEQTCADFGIHYCRGKPLSTLYAEMLDSFRSPRDLANELANVVL